MNTLSKTNAMNKPMSEFESAAADIKELGDNYRDFYAKLRIGHMVQNGYVSNDSPYRFQVVIGKYYRTGRLNTGRTIKVMDSFGKLGEFIIRHDSKMVVVGYVPIMETINWAMDNPHLPKHIS